MSAHFQQGWQQQNLQEGYDHGQIVSKFVTKQKPLGILTSTKHSLEPDMIFGWRPKLASCPLPLRFHNQKNQKILSLLVNTDLYRLAYKSRHFSSSVEVNQTYPYYWKYRSRYSLNMALIQEAAKQQELHSLSQPIIHLNHNSPLELQFSSQFQSGNLDFAVRVKPTQYDCFIRSDSNTKGHCNWYYFSIKNHQRIGQVKINVCNIGKTRNLYNKGMKPFVKQVFREQDQIIGHSKEQLKKKQYEWCQERCYDVEFVERICKYGTQNKRWELQFKYNFSKPNMEVFFAYGIPYTYSKLEKFIKQISCQENKNILTVAKLCQSLGGLNIPLLKITNNAIKQIQIETHKKAVLLSARIHPGESHSSYVIQGVIRQLLKDTEQAKILREIFTFYIIPMINVDGVVVGNYRTSYSGKDLNRQFCKQIDRFVFPQISSLHQLALQIRQKHFKGIEFYLDFHGHSSKKNLFAYGPQHSPKNIYFFKSRIFPRLIEDVNEIFSYKKSIFHISEGKRKTARAHMLWKLKIPMVYTFQVSNGMYETKKKEDILIDSEILIEAGRSVMQGFWKYVRMEMRIPAKLLMKKPKENIKKRMIKSSKGIRDQSVNLKRKISKPLLQSVQMDYLSQKLVVCDKSRIYSKNEQILLKDSPLELDNHEQQQKIEGMEQFLKLVEDIKKTKMQDDLLEGGSDSESDQEDMDKQDMDKLFKIIKNRKVLKQIKKKRKVDKSSKKKIVEEETSNIFQEIKKQLKRYKSSELEQLIKETKKLTNNLNNINPGSKGLITNKSSSKIKLMNLNATNIQGKDNFMGEKQNLVKVPLRQKHFCMEI